MLMLQMCGGYFEQLLSITSQKSHSSQALAKQRKLQNISVIQSIESNITNPVYSSSSKNKVFLKHVIFLTFMPPQRWELYPSHYINLQMGLHISLILLYQQILSFQTSVVLWREIRIQVIKRTIAKLNCLSKRTTN